MNVEHNRNNEERGQIEVSLLEGTDIRLYQDEGTKRLAEVYDSSTYQGYLASYYGETNTEHRLHSFLALGKAAGKYYGLDREGLYDLSLLLENLGKGHRVDFPREDTHIFRPLNELLPDVRIVEYEGRQVFFPTERMLYMFDVQRRDGVPNIPPPIPYPPPAEGEQ